MTRPVTISIIFLAVLLVAIAWVIFGRDPPILQPGDADLVAQGRTIYAANCASCHGGNLEGEANWRSRGQDGMMRAPPHNQTGHTWHHADQILFDLTKFGVGRTIGQNYNTNMPVFEDVLTDQEIIAVLSYIKSTWSTVIRDTHDKINAETRNE